MVVIGAALAGAAACGGGGSATDAGPDLDAAPAPIDAPSWIDPSAVLYDPDHILDVAIEIDEAEWEALRAETRSFIGLLAGDTCLDEPFAVPFLRHPAGVTVDGVTLAPVAIRKKGFLGSLSDVKPSLKILTDAYVPGQELHGTDELVLNNSVQDPSYVRQCLAYQVLARAGVAGPRCSFARVSVNGRDLGLYVHVEGVKKSLLRRAFGSDSGTLYEGTLSDFREGWEGTFEKETREDEPGRPGVNDLTRTLVLPDDELVTALERLLDVREFTTFWAAEVLLRHWDGYAGNTNNFYLYDDPLAGKLRFVPWGTDQVMQRPRDGERRSVMATGVLARRLYFIPETRDFYVARMRGLLQTAWREDELFAEIDRMQALITPIADPDGSVGLADAIEDVRGFIRTRAGEIEAELADGPPSWDADLREPICFDTIGTVTGTFATTWGTRGASDPLVAGDGKLTLDVRGATPQFLDVGSTVGFRPDVMDARTEVTVVGLPEAGRLRVLVLDVASPRVGRGVTTAIDWVLAQGVLYEVDLDSGDVTTVAWVGDGTVSFDEAATTEGSIVTGRFEAELIENPW